MITKVTIGFSIDAALKQRFEEWVAANRLNRNRIAEDMIKNFLGDLA